jgi:hypothetical protein
MVRERERGAGNFGCIMGILILVAGVIIATKAIPPKIAVAELNDFAVRQAESASLPHHSNQDITEAIIRKAQELKLPVDPENVTVSRNSEQVRVEVSYRVVIEFPFYTYNWDVKHKIERTLF